MNKTTNNNAAREAGQTQRKQTQTYRMEYPCTICFDVEATDIETASTKACAFLDTTVNGLAQDVELNGVQLEGVMVYPKVSNHSALICPGELTLVDRRDAS